MSRTYLFRFDGARANDAFLGSASRQGFFVFGGIEMRVGSCRWEPDFLLVTSSESQAHICLTLIELEATEPVAKVSCRKYLPESSIAIVEAFAAYLDRIVGHCRTTADLRLSRLLELRTALRLAKQVAVRTGGGLRTADAPLLVEQWPLLDQPSAGAVFAPVPALDGSAPLSLEGVVLLTPLQNMILHRALIIIDASLRRQIHTGATLKTWARSRHQTPLARSVGAESARFPVLKEYLSVDKRMGLRLDAEQFLQELSELWGSQSTSAEASSIRSALERCFPLAATFSESTRMADVFLAVESVAKSLRDEAATAQQRVPADVAAPRR